MQIDWHKLRMFNGSQQSAFEELCCQLAACEPVPDGVHFERKGTPDAGVECYWQRRDGSEWGWQAKFFLESLGNAQWQQIDKSVKTALRKHPALTECTICIPQDKPDARKDNEKSFKEKWDVHVEKWKGWAGDRKMDVDFKYWGSHEIFLRLSKEEHAGRHYFWFHGEFLHQPWFKNHLGSVIADAGDRYTPYANVELPFLDLFDALARTKGFLQRFNDSLADAATKLNGLPSDWLPNGEKGPPVALTETIPELLQEGAKGLGQPQGRLPLKGLEDTCDLAVAALGHQSMLIRDNRHAQTRPPHAQPS